MAAGDYFLNLGHLTGLGMAGVDSDSATPLMAAGTVAIVRDRLGPRILKYIRAQAAFTRGQLVSKPGATDGTEEVDNITAGSVTSATTTGRTANNDQGKICVCYDNADSAGAAPEGEFSVIAGNTTTVLTMEPALPFSVALAVNDDLALIGTYQAEASAAGDFAHAVQGVVVGAQGIASGNYGWVQCEGITKATLKSEALTKNGGLVSDVSQLGVAGSNGIELWCGVVLHDVSADQAAETGVVRLQLFAAQGTGGTP